MHRVWGGISCFRSTSACIQWGPEILPSHLLLSLSVESFHESKQATDDDAEAEVEKKNALVQQFKMAASFHLQGLRPRVFPQKYGFIFLEPLRRSTKQGKCLDFVKLCQCFFFFFFQKLKSI